MMSSTYTALRSQGISSRALQQSAKRNFSDGTGRNATDMPDDQSWHFWNAMISSRRKFRLKTGFHIESILRG